MIKSKKGITPVGVVKELDGLGRLVISKEIRTLYGLEREIEMVSTKSGGVTEKPRLPTYKNQIKAITKTYNNDNNG